MIRIYQTDHTHHTGGQFMVLDSVKDVEVDERMVWFDVDQPTHEEEDWLEAKLNIELPTKEDMKDIEPSSRLYREKGATFMTASLLWKADSDLPETTHVAFILVQGRLVTIRYAEPKPFTAFQLYAARNGTVCSSGVATMLGLLEAIIDRMSEVLEKASVEVEDISQKIAARRLQATGRHRKRVHGAEELEQHLGNIVACQNLSAKVRDSLMSLGRVVSFLPLAPEFDKNWHGADNYRENIGSLGHDVQSLIDHTTFLNANLNFLLDAALGLINIEQNSIIKIFSIAAVVFLPPTMVASVYGMNFHDMPELGWHLGYPMALGMMVISAVGPYWFFKQRGWL